MNTQALIRGSVLSIGLLLIVSCNMLPSASDNTSFVRKDPRKMEFAPVKAKLPQIQEFTLANGIQVIFIENRELPLLDVRAQLAGGWVYLPANKAGEINLFSDVIRTGGAGNRSGDEINDFLESRAASV
ncbi:MAG: hypothetical protein COY19_01110, partial [Candidatus Marinimicrobia bacterium CG_4_10_14_0_2_um_filter_48_9]